MGLKQFVILFQAIKNRVKFPVYYNSGDLNLITMVTMTEHFLATGFSCPSNCSN
jgi:hypothetical protein